jgi:hypothetical protein
VLKHAEIEGAGEARLTEPAGRDAREQYGADKGTVDDKWPGCEGFEDAQGPQIANKDERLATTSPKISTDQPCATRRSSRNHIAATCWPSLRVAVERVSRVGP